MAIDTLDATPGEANIEISVSRLQQLFNSLDPSPFHERDLDRNAEEYILGSAEELPLKKALRLVIHLPADQRPAADATDLGTAIHNYFAYQETQSRRRLRLLFRDGRVALIIGLAFLFVCIVLREVAFSFGTGTVSEIIAEGMLIIGWVAMWRPLEIFLYDWWPIRRRCRVYLRNCPRYPSSFDLAEPFPVAYVAIELAPECPLMEWSGRAPAPPASDAGLVCPTSKVCEPFAVR